MRTKEKPFDAEFHPDKIKCCHGSGHDLCSMH